MDFKNYHNQPETYDIIWNVYYMSHGEVFSHFIMSWKQKKEHALLRYPFRGRNHWNLDSGPPHQPLVTPLKTTYIGTTQTRTIHTTESPYQDNSYKKFWKHFQRQWENQPVVICFRKSISFLLWVMKNRSFPVTFRGMSCSGMNWFV